MSHYFVIVLTRPRERGLTWEETRKAAITEAGRLLAPFDESLCCEFAQQPQKELDELRKRYETDEVNVVEIDGEFVGRFDQRFRVPGALFSSLDEQYAFPPGAVIQKRKQKDRYATFDKFVETVSGDKDPITGQYGYWMNPLAKWDWWVVGGRWDAALLGNEHRHRDTNNHHMNEHDDLVKEGNVRRVSEIPLDNLTCFAIVGPHGEWISNGKMGWWACTIGELMTKEEWHLEVKRILALPVHQDCIAVGCDLHI